jgi:DNA-binding transcriptional ArsR family regulator
MALTELRYLERVVRGFASHRRIQILQLLSERPELDLMQIARACGIQFRNASEHVRRLAYAGLVIKRSKGRQVLHKVAPRGRQVLTFLRALQRAPVPTTPTAPPARD